MTFSCPFDRAYNLSIFILGSKIHIARHNHQRGFILALFTLSQENIELARKYRSAIHAAKDQAPASTIKDLQARFGVSGNIIGAALERTTVEWQAMAASAPARNAYRPRASPALDDTMVIPKEATSSQTSSTSQCHACEYKAIILHGRAVLGDIVYEQQGKNGGDWKPIQATTFEGVLNTLTNNDLPRTESHHDSLKSKR